MKKLLLSAVFAMVSLTTTFAAQLNPFAYNLYVTEENGQPKLHFFLNADADRVRVILSDGEQDYVLRDYPTSQSELPYVPFHPQGYGTILTDEDVARLNLPADKDIFWRYLNSCNFMIITCNNHIVLYVIELMMVEVFLFLNLVFLIGHMN